VLENAAGIAHSRSNANGEEVNTYTVMLCAIVGLGYQIESFLADAWSHGNCQSRTRLILAITTEDYEPLSRPPRSVILNAVVKCADTSPSKTVTKPMVFMVLRQMGMRPDGINLPHAAALMAIPFVIARPASRASSAPRTAAGHDRGRGGTNKVAGKM
jgi:site-specific DNA-cytosine methylase